MRAVFDYVRVVADSDSSILITGETGTGKELIANLIHQASHRRGRAFVPVSCAIFAETLIESELFGHERGAFTGAIKDRPGRFEAAEGGTIFLDDVDDVPMSVQVKLLRVLQNRVVERVGGARAIPIDVRTITGTKRDLRHMVSEGKFREDLYYRLNVIPITLPPLRERREDIPLLAEHFLKRFYQRREQPVAPAVAGRAAGVHALSVARQRARARERVRADRPDLHLRHGEDRLRADQRAVPSQQRGRGARSSKRTRTRRRCRSRSGSGTWSRG